MSSNILRVEWCGDYELHFHVDAETRRPVAGPITVYFPLEKRALEQRFIACPGLSDKNSPDFDPQARPIVEGNRDTFSIGPDGIRTSTPYVAGVRWIIDELRASGRFKHVFYPAPLPEARWDNIGLEQCSLTAELADFCKTLEPLLADGFVECYGYQIPDGVLEDTVLQQKSWPNNPAFFVELFRHPLIRSDLSLNEVDEQVLFSVGNWSHYSPFLISGFMAQTLVHGGAYGGMENNVASALESADKAFQSLNRDYRNLELHVCHKGWCHFLFDGAWNDTWVIFDREIRRLFVLIASDID